MLKFLTRDINVKTTPRNQAKLDFLDNEAVSILSIFIVDKQCKLSKVQQKKKDILVSI